MPRISFALSARRLRATHVGTVLTERYPSPRCELDYASPFQLLIAVILSAQTSDKAVNKVTPELFGRFPDAPSLAKAPLLELRKILRSIGFFRAKARSIRGTAQAIMKRYGGEVPREMAALITLPGVARKTANVVLGEAFEIAEGIAVDTHVARVSKRLGLTKSTSPPEIERDLMQVTPRTDWGKGHLRMVLFGRYHCTARSPKCTECPLLDVCIAPESAAVRDACHE
ncbi:MAG: endonuclease III [Deltaproteobacteria bacterium]|nr:endonuclease III [Deltaproteobacteria bacterium]